MPVHRSPVVAHLFASHDAATVSRRTGMCITRSRAGGPARDADPQRGWASHGLETRDQRRTLDDETKSVHRVSSDESARLVSDPPRPPQAETMDPRREVLLSGCELINPSACRHDRGPGEPCADADGNPILQSRAQADDNEPGIECDELTGVGAKLREPLISVDTHRLEVAEAFSRLERDPRPSADKRDFRALVKQAEDVRGDEIRRGALNGVARARERHLQERSVDPNEVDPCELFPVGVQQRIVVEPSDDPSGLHHLPGAFFEGIFMSGGRHAFTMSQIMTVDSITRA